ncbi:SDR family oxidoreductase [Phenylobacterium terrae]|uniref:SDR family oxidoreductase n=1 Tax=Phenylobacterium terrae TaxID=2665495 RepID=A0ABW4N6Y4_9CAUL
MPLTAPVLVIGGTRGAGLRIVERLVAGDRTVRVLARDPAAARSRLPGGVEVVAGDLTRPETLEPAVRGAAHLVFTAGAPSGRYAPERVVKATDYDGVLHTLASLGRTGFTGRFVYLNSMGVTRPSIWAMLINLLKRNTLDWRRRAEAAIRESGVDYTIIRVGFLTNGPGGKAEIAVTQSPLPLSPRHRISRQDLARAFAAALDHPRASRATFEITATKGPPGDLDARLAALQPDCS